MTDAEANERRLQLILKYAAENRRAEISLLWARSSFFWAFLAVAIASYGGAIFGQHRTLALLVACFAAICSLCWTLANRSGKYWQVVWEKKVEAIEQEALDKIIFTRSSNPIVDESWFWGAKQYSPSRLASAVSDLAFGLWGAVAFWTTFSDAGHPITLIRILILLATVIYAASILIWCRSGVVPPRNMRETWAQLCEAGPRCVAAIRSIFLG